MDRYFPPVCVHEITFRDLKEREGRKQKESGMQNKVTEISWQHEKKRFEFLEI